MWWCKTPSGENCDKLYVLKTCLHTEGKDLCHQGLPPVTATALQTQLSVHITQGNEVFHVSFPHPFVQKGCSQHDQANSRSLSLLQYTMFMCCAILITIVQYCNFCQLSSWMRSVLATVVGAVLLILLYVSLCPDRWASHPAPTVFGRRNLCFSARNEAENMHAILVSAMNVSGVSKVISWSRERSAFFWKELFTAEGRHSDLMELCCPASFLAFLSFQGVLQNINWRDKVNVK